MRWVIRLLRKVIVARFYERNAGLFLFIFYLMFGIVESSQLVYYHFSMMVGIISSSIFLLAVFSIWTLYMLKCLQFIFSALELPQNEFLFRIGMLSPVQQIVSLLTTAVLVDFPVLGYSVVLIGVALYSGKLSIAAYILLFHATAIFWTVLLLKRKINSPHIQTFSLHLPELQWKLPRPLPFFYLGHLTDRMKTILWVTKGFSIFSLLGFFQIQEDYDIRVPLLGFLFGLAAHAVIVFEFRRFEDQYLGFTRNLPIRMIGRFGTLIIVYAIILLPEFILMLINRVHIGDAAGSLFFGVGFLTLNHCMLYRTELDMEKYQIRLLVFFLISFMVVLCHLYLAEAAVLWSSAFVLLSRNFYHFEGAKG